MSCPFAATEALGPWCCTCRRSGPHRARGRPAIPPARPSARLRGPPRRPRVAHRRRTLTVWTLVSRATTQHSTNTAPRLHLFLSDRAVPPVAAATPSLSLPHSRIVARGRTKGRAAYCIHARTRVLPSLLFCLHLPSPPTMAVSASAQSSSAEGSVLPSHSKHSLLAVTGFSCVLVRKADRARVK